jgi:hypothetical protein
VQDLKNAEGREQFKLQKLKCEFKFHAIGNWFRGKKLYFDVIIIYIFIIKSKNIIKKNSAILTKLKVVTSHFDMVWRKYFPAVFKLHLILINLHF